MSVIRMLSYLPIDLGQGQYKHSTKAKQIAWENVPEAHEHGTALDIGCGDGYWSEMLKKKGYKVTSIDILNDHYPNVDADAPYAHMTVMNANEKLALPSDSFDLVWSTEVIEHLTNYRTTLSEIRRVLKPGGRAVLATPNSYFWLHYLLKMVGVENKDWQNEGHVNFFSIADIKTFFPSQKIYGYFFYLPLLKYRIPYGISLLSPSFVVVYSK